MKILIIPGLVGLIGSSAEAALSFECRSAGNVFVRGSANAEKVVATIVDSEGQLGIRDGRNRDFKGELTLTYTRVIRKKEEHRAFARYYNDFTAWDGLDLSIPKKPQGRFVLYFTIFTDNGDIMAPGESVRFSCSNVSSSI